MSEQTSFDPNAPIPIEVLIGMPFNLIVETWETIQPVAHLDAEIFDRAPAILDTVGLLTGHSGLDRLRGAVSAQDGHALGALVSLDVNLGMTCDALIERCKRWKLDRKWVALRHEAGLAVRVAAASGRAGRCALAWFLLANAYRALGDNKGTIDAYGEAIQAASKAGDVHLLAVANDNLGNALTDVGRLDEAIEHFKEALLYERDAKGLNIIRNNLSNALRELGELRSAAQVLQDAVAALESTGLASDDLAVMLDNTAMTLASLGEPAAALELIERAHSLFSPDNLLAQAVNVLNRSTVLNALGDKSAAAQAFIEGHDLAFAHVRRYIDPDHYRRGFLASLPARLPSNDGAYRLLGEGLAAGTANRFGEALELYQQGTQLARKAGDHALALRIDANAAKVLFDAGQFEQAHNIACRVRHEAGSRGLARPELMAIGTLQSLSASGLETHDPLGVLGNLATCAILLEIHIRIAAEAGLDPMSANWEVYDPGTIANELAMVAASHHADELALRYFREAVDKARAVKGWFELANRLAGLCSVLARSGNSAEANTVAEELTRLLATDLLSDRGRLVAHRALGLHFADQDSVVAIGHLKQARVILEALRQRIPPGTRRSDVARQMQGLCHTLARLLRESGETAAAFEALQSEKGRRLIDALAALRPESGQVRDEPPNAGEVMALIDRLGGDTRTVLVDLAVEQNGLTAYLVTSGSLKAVHVPGVLSTLAAVEQGDVFERESRMVGLCQHERLLCDLAEAVAAEIPAGRSLLLVPDAPLHNLPLHLVPVRGRPLCDHFSIGCLPAAGLLRFAPGRRQPVGYSLIAGDSRGDLPYATAECSEIAAILGATPLLGQHCTRAAVEATLRSGELDFVHLALHGRGDARRGGRASLLLADGAGGVEWVAFDELAAFPWQVELVVFSGCSTAVAGPRQGHELIGVARAAAERGAAAVIACLWPVGDQAAKVFMTAFYEKLILRRATGPVELRRVMDHARHALRSWIASVPRGSVQRRDGRHLNPVAMAREKSPEVDPEVVDALAWGPFILFGDPILGN